jgi:hypothetical protein
MTRFALLRFRRLPIFLMIGPLVVVLSGCACRRDAAMQLATKATYANAFLGVTETLEPLRDLRAGNTNGAIEVLENRLDEGIIELSAILPEQRDEKKRAAYVRTLMTVRDYRATHPWRSTISSELEQNVAKALANIPEEAVAR